jgi:hypothetical protein
MGGASSSPSGGGSNRYEPPQKKNPVVEFVKGGGVTGAIIRTVKKGIEKSKAKKEANVEMGLGTDRISNYTTPSDNNGGNDNPILSTNTEATNQVASSGIVTNTGIVAPAPTTAEVSQATSTMMSDAEISVANKKKGRSTTILSRATGLGNSNLNTTKKTLGA